MCKTGSIIYTKEKISNARRNIEKYAWARELHDEAVAKAEEYVAKGYDYLWNLVMPQTLPRSFSVHYELGSPITGKELLKKYGMYSWELNPDGKEWKILDPSSGYIFPTNDFSAFYRSGLDEHGVFQRDLADESLLINELYPEKGPKWGVDDGLGWVDAEGNRWTFVAYYTHWSYRQFIEDAMEALRDAYLYTGDRKYSRAGIVLLDRLADLYPSYDVAAWGWNDGYKNSHGLTGEGKFLGSIWETAPAKTWVSAYDAFFSAIDDAEAIRFLSNQAKKCRLDNPKNSAEAIRKNIEDGIVREILPAVKTAKIRGNHGMHESTLAMAAVVLDDPGTVEEPGVTREMIDFIFQPGRLESAPYRVTGGDLMGTLVDHVDRDGMGSESSPGYNRIWISGMKQVANFFEGYTGYAGADLYKNVKFKKLLASQHPLVMLGKYTPQIGDTGSVGSKGTILRLDDYLKAFERYEEPILAQVAYFINGNSTNNIRGDIFSADPGALATKIQQVIEEYGPWQPESVNLTGYGFAALRDGKEWAAGDTRRGLWMYYGRNHTGHAHRDALNLDLYAYGLSLAPELGYPEKASTYPKRGDWTSHTISHNTVMVDNTKQQNSWVGIPHHFDDGKLVKLIDVSAPRAYSQTDLYRRTTAMVWVDEERSYVVDFFRVKGGQEHLFSFHGSQATMMTEGLNLVPQEQGTYAGPDQGFGERRDNSGRQWLKNVSRDANPPSLWSVDWAIEDFLNVAPQDQDVHLRLTMVGDVDSVALADGEPPQKQGNPETLKYLLARRSGKDLNSLFTAVLEPYNHDRFIESIAPAGLAVADASPAESAANFLEQDGAVAVKVTHKSGRIDYIVTSLNSERTYFVDGKFQFSGFFGVYSYEKENGAPIHAYLSDGTLLGHKDLLVQDSHGSITGKVRSFTKELSLTNELSVQVDQSLDRLEELIGRYIYVENDGERNAAYQIRGIKEAGEGLYTLDLGDNTLVRRFVDPANPGDGYVYEVSEGDAFAIPLFCEKRTPLGKQ